MASSDFSDFSGARRESDTSAGESRAGSMTGSGVDGGELRGFSELWGSLTGDEDQLRRS